MDFFSDCAKPGIISIIRILKQTRHFKSPSLLITPVKTHHYKQGQKYGHLASAIPKSKYRLIIRDTTWTHAVPANPGAYSQAALVARTLAAQ